MSNAVLTVVRLCGRLHYIYNPSLPQDTGYKNVLIEIQNKKMLSVFKSAYFFFPFSQRRGKI